MSSASPSRSPSPGTSYKSSPGVVEIEEGSPLVAPAVDSAKDSQSGSAVASPEKEFVHVVKEPAPEPVVVLPQQKPILSPSRSRADHLLDSKLPEDAKEVIATSKIELVPLPPVAAPVEAPLPAKYSEVARAESRRSSIDEKKSDFDESQYQNDNLEEIPLSPEVRRRALMKKLSTMQTGSASLILTSAKDAGCGELKYNAINVRDPRKFAEAGYASTLKFQDLKILIVVTMYNEEPNELALTIRGICENIKHWTNMFEDDLKWRDIGVVIVSDGRSKLNPDTATLMEEAGIFKASMMQVPEDNSELGCHVFQCEASFFEDEKEGIRYPPLQTIFALKEHNGSKLDSHWWFLEAFAANMNPKYLLFLDVGVRLLKESLFHIYRCFERNKQIGALSGEPVIREVGSTSAIIASQYLEYKVSTILDRSFESVTGFLSVLPGCLSAYRHDVLKGDILRIYFKYLENKDEHPDPFMSLLYLAEDRLLSMEIFAKNGENNVLHYLKDAVGEVDVCTDIVELMKQRRRWINSTCAALLFFMYNYSRILFHDLHSIFRKASVSFTFLYYLILLVQAWVSPGVYCIFIDISLETVLRDVPYAVWAYRAVFFTFLLLQLVYGLSGGKLQDKKRFYTLSMNVFGLVFVASSLAVIYTTISGLGTTFQLFILLGMILTTSIYFIVAIIHGELLTVLISFGQYWFSIPVYVYILPLYTVCNLNDISWGTKSNGPSGAGQSKQVVDSKKQFVRNALTFRNFTLLVYLCGNVVAAALGITYFRNMGDMAYSEGVFVWFAWFTIIFLSVRLVASIIFVILNKINKQRELYQHYTEISQVTSVQVNHKETVQKTSDSKSSTHKTKGSYCLFVMKHYLTVPFKRSTWISFINILLVNWIFAIFAFAWTLATGALLIPVCWTWMFPYCLGIAATTWRFLGAVEFSYNSFDGVIARIFRGVAKHKSGTGTLTSAKIVLSDESNPTIGGSLKKIAEDPMTIKTFFYFVYIKPTVTLFTSIVSLCSVVVCLLLVLEPWISMDMMNSFSLTHYLVNLPIAETVRANVVYEALTSLNPITSTVIGGVGLLICVPIMKHLDSNCRRVVNLTIGVQPVSLFQTMKLDDLL